MRSLAVALLRWLAETLVRLYYPRRTIEGAEHIPPTGPTLYVANHPNGLLDPLVLRVSIGRAARFLAKSTLWGNPFGRLAMDAFKCLPVYRQQDLATSERGSSSLRNEESFARCRAELAAGAELALYPEGISHADPQLRPLKPGAARIALSAAAEAAEVGIARAPTLIPVGTYYEDRSRFRSAVHLVVGEPIELVDLAARFVTDQRQTVEDLTGKIRVRLDQLVLQAESRELLAGIARVASWTAKNADDDTPERRHVRARELSAAYMKLQASNPARVEQVARAARRYARTLERLGVPDPWALEIPRMTMVRLAAVLGRALLLTPIALWGVATSWPAYRLSGVVAVRMTTDEDVLSTIKMIAGATFLAAAWIAEALLVGFTLGVWWGLVSILVAPIAGYSALRLGETLGDVAETVRHFGWRSHDHIGQRLAERRRHLAEQVAAALREAGP